MQREETTFPEFTLRTLFFSLALILGTFLHFENYIGVSLNWPTLYGVLAKHLTGIGVPEMLTQAVAVTAAFLVPVLVPALWAIKVDPVFNKGLGRWARKPLSGVIILAAMLSLMYQLVGNLGAQISVAVLEESLFGHYLTPFLQNLIPAGFLHD